MGHAPAEDAGHATGWATVTSGTSVPDGTLLRELATQVHGGIGGFMGVTMSALSPDEARRWSTARRRARA